MDWIFDNLWTLIIVATVIAQMIQAIRKKGAPDEEGAPPPAKEFEFDDPELAERTRKIRDDIRRKIEERQRGRTPEPTPAPAPVESQWDSGPEDEVPVPPVVREVAPERVPPPVVYGTRLETQRQAEILEQQAALADQLRQAEELKAAALRRAAFEARTADAGTIARQQTRGALVDDLRSPEALRRAFILREVLGPPVGLR